MRDFLVDLLALQMVPLVMAGALVAVPAWHFALGFAAAWSLLDGGHQATQRCADVERARART